MNKNPLLIMFVVVILTVFTFAAIENEVSDKIIVGKDYGNFKLDGGEATILEDYEGVIEFNEGGGKVIFEDKGVSHEFRGGMIKIKGGEVVSITDAKVTRYEIPVSFDEGRFEVKNFKFFISGENINYNSEEEIFITGKIISISEEGKNKKDLVPESGKIIKISLKGESNSVPVIDTGGDFAKVTSDNIEVGLINGEFLFNSHVNSPGGAESKEILFVPDHFIRVGYEEFGPDFTILPSEGEETAEMKLKNGLNAKVSGVTFINHMESKKLVDKTIYRDELDGLISGIALNGDLHVLATGDNKIELEFDELRFGFINQDLVHDESSVNIKLKRDESKDTEILFSKSEPLIRGETGSSVLVGTKFTDEKGIVWSWEFNKVIDEPRVFRNRILFLSSGDTSPQSISRESRFIDPRTGQIIKKAAPLETNINRLLAEPLILRKDSSDLGNVVVGVPLHEQTVIDQRSFMNKADFFKALKEGNPDNEKYDRLYVSSFGLPGKLILGPISNIKKGKYWFRSDLVTLDDIKSLPREDVEKIRGNFASTARCSVAACYFFGASNKDEKASRQSLGAEFTRLINIPVTGSVPIYSVTAKLNHGFDVSSFKDIESTNIIIAYPEGDDVRFKENPLD